MFRRTVTAGLAVLTLAAAGGCADEKPTLRQPSASPSPTASPVAAGPPWYDGVAPAQAAGSIGGKDSPCQLPIIFSVPANWRAEAVTVGKDAEIGGAVPVCEIDARPAGNIGFLRVWTIASTYPPQQVMDRFLDADGRSTERQYRRTKVGPLDAFEATYVEPGGGRKRAALVSSPHGPVLLALGGADNQEFEAMFPAYQLARQSAKTNRE
jgi:hypothetical protein